MRSNFRNSQSAARLSLVTLASVSASLLSACAYIPSVSGDKVLGLVRPYRLEVVQGNVLTKELVARVKPGMPKAQVRDLLGSPLLTDVFHDNRWDYVFTIRRQGAEPQKRQVVAWFDGDRLKSLEVPDDLPTENDFVAAINTKGKTGNLPKLELSEAERQALPLPPKREAPAVAEAMGAQRSYPPLESKQ
ncbi:outer membrane protein assembly factor BamE [Roseateles koreensis]|uniref:Outer membrane protein assembly factor BamE n=1 Tax=Roseateles koreensis TaxID=2987526 RepID=A0ABT5KW26_9BURK|nr:outer membrane protein assembly factor BamE [Roseateles koreensis]MDC8787002.1 outer membrane protein assembly factor BamE [Roseateles koreensis]